MRLLLKPAGSIPQNVSSIAGSRRSGTLARTDRTTEVVAEIDELMTGAFQRSKTAESNEDRPDQWPVVSALPTDGMNTWASFDRPELPLAKQRVNDRRVPVTRRWRVNKTERQLSHHAGGNSRPKAKVAAAGKRPLNVGYEGRRRRPSRSFNWTRKVTASSGAQSSRRSL